MVNQIFIRLGIPGVSQPQRALVLVLVIAAIGTSLAAEHIAPFENQWNSSHGDGGRDVLHALVNEGSLVA